MNTLPKVVFSKTLSAAEWSGSRIARGDLAAEIADLKSGSEGEIMAHGTGQQLGWYVNLQSPWRRTSVGFEAMDMMLDVVRPRSNLAMEGR